MESLAPSVRAAQAIGIISSAFLSGLFLISPQCNIGLFSIVEFVLLSTNSLIMFLGGILAFSYGFVPAVSQAPNTLLVREWQTAYTRGTAASPALAIISTLSYIYLSYSLLFTAYHQVAQLYALSALATCSIVPYTLICMKSVNGKLKNKVQDSMELDRSEEMNESKARKGEHSDELLGWWSILNAGRGMLPFIGACLGIYASVS